MAEMGGFDRLSADGAVINALAEASAEIARLDQALIRHPLRQAFLYRARLDAVRRQAAVDGALIDPWHLAAILEGLRLRMDPYLRIIDRGRILEAARTAFGLYQWIVEPDFDQEGEVQRAEADLAAQPATLPTLLAAAEGFWGWIEKGEQRAPMRAAVIRFWVRRHLVHEPVPLTGAAALGAERSWEPENWLATFLQALAQEASEGLELLRTIERSWFEARRSIPVHRKTSHAAAAVDVLAATPVLSATSLAGILGIAVKNAIRILDELQASGIAIEVTYRSKRRLFGLKGLAPLREVVRPPYQPEPGRGPGRPRKVVEEEPASPPVPLPPLTPVERMAFDYTDLEEAMAHAERTIRKTRRELAALVQRDQAARKDQVTPVAVPNETAASASAARSTCHLEQA